MRPHPLQWSHGSGHLTSAQLFMIREHYGALYRMGGQMVAPLHPVDFARQSGVQAPQTTGGINILIR
jgi:hypothetical protein